MHQLGTNTTLLSWRAWSLFLIIATTRGVLSLFYSYTRAPSGPIAPSHPQSGDQLVWFLHICVRMFATEERWNSGLWTALIELSSSSLPFAWFISLSGISLWKTDSPLYTSSAFFSLLSLPRHASPILQTDESKQEGYSRASECCSVDTVLLITVPGTRTILPVQYLAESLCWLYIHASLCCFLLKRSHIYGQSRARQRETAGAIWSAGPPRCSFSVNKSRKSPEERGWKNILRLSEK